MWTEDKPGYEPTWKHKQLCDYCASKGVKTTRAKPGCDHFRGGKTAKNRRNG